MKQCHKADCTLGSKDQSNQKLNKTKLFFCCILSPEKGVANQLAFVLLVPCSVVVFLEVDVLPNPIMNLGYQGEKK